MMCLTDSWKLRRGWFCFKDEAGGYHIGDLEKTRAYIYNYENQEYDSVYKELIL